MEEKFGVSAAVPIYRSAAIKGMPAFCSTNAKKKFVFVLAEVYY
jgi:hypothetical protein